MLFHDERAPERHHHQDPQDASGEGEHRDLEVVEVARAPLPEEDQRGDGEDHAGGHRLAGRPDGLDDVVFEDRGAAEPLQHRDRQHRDRDGRADREAGTQAEVDGRGAEDQPERRAEDDGLGREFSRRLRGRNIGLECRAGLGGNSRTCGSVGHRCAILAQVIGQPSAKADLSRRSRPAKLSGEGG